MPKYVVTKRPHYGPDGRTYQPGEVMTLPDTDDPDKQIKPGKLLKPYKPGAKVDASKAGPTTTKGKLSPPAEKPAATAE